jgi:hypothetical protein
VEGVESMLRIVKKRPFSGTTAATIESQANPRRHTSCQLALLGRPRGQCAGISHEGIHGSTGTNGPQAPPAASDGGSGGGRGPGARRHAAAFRGTHSAAANLRGKLSPAHPVKLMRELRKN